MQNIRPLAGVVWCVFLSFPLGLVGCGGGGTINPPQPVFTSTPPTAAAEGVAYTYQISATDPSGGTVSFSLGAGPSGASISGGTLNWIPIAAQSRISDSFTVKATTSSGGTSEQSWMVSPSGTITVNAFTTNWTPTGPVQSGAALPLVSAIVPNADGSVTILPGSPTGPGVATIANVPAGYYWLVSFSDAFWTSSSTVDLGRDVAGSPISNTTLQDTTFDLNLSGLESVTAPGLITFSNNTWSFPFGLALPAGSTNLGASTSSNSTVDWSKISSVFLNQYEPVLLGSLNNVVLGPSAVISNPGFSDGTTNTIAANLQASPQQSIDINIPGSQWASAFNNVGPSVASPVGSDLFIVAEPYVTGRNESPNGLVSNLLLVAPNATGFSGALVPQSGPCLGGASSFSFFQPTSQAAIFNDQDFGTLQYGDPFPASWTRALAFCQEASVEIPAGGSVTFPIPFNIASGVAVPPSSSPIAPLTGPVQNATINGASLFSAATLNTTVVTLSWVPPAQGLAPYGYEVTVVGTQSSGMLATAGFFRTAKTSVTLPPLVPAYTYIFSVTAAVDGTANIETGPYRSSLPAAFSEVVSAPITISSSAQPPKIRGDANTLMRLVQPRTERR
jgi:hypothetical protein